MDPDPPSSTPRKVRFAPKGPPRRKPKPPESKTKVADNDADDEAAAKYLLRRVDEHLGRRRPKEEKKSSVQVAFGHGAALSTSIRTFGKPREGNGDKSNGSGLRDSARDSGKIIVSSLSTATTDGSSGSAVNTVNASSQKIEKAYREPWDYHRTYYPITLPLRRPYSGDPELLDEAEFGGADANLEYDEKIINSASELGLLDENDREQMLFLQLPPNLPLFKRVATADGRVTEDGSKLIGSEGASAKAKGKEVAGISISLGGTVTLASAKGKEIHGSSVPSRDANVSGSAKGKEVVGSSISSGKGNASKMGCSLEELPGGCMGKMLVYKSGAVKLKLGETLYDVSPGSNCVFAQDVVAINTIDKQCCVLGELGKRAVVAPDIDSLLDNVIDLS